MNIETLEAFGMGLAVIISLLVQGAGNVKILASPKVRFVAPGVIALVFTVAFYLAQSPRPPVYIFLVKWFGLWVMSTMTHATVKDAYKQRPPEA